MTASEKTLVSECKQLKPSVIYLKSSSEPLETKHLAYLNKKGIAKEDIPGLRFGYYYKVPALIIPLKNLNGDIQSIQYIYYDKDNVRQRRFSKDTYKSGCFLALDPLEDGKKLFITEGIATAVSLKKIIEKSHDLKGSLVVCAFSSENTPKVAKLLQERFGYSEIISAPDADNSGNSSAIKCRESGVFSIFPPKKRNSYDWNDAHLDLGLEQALEELENSIAFREISRLSGEPIKTIPEIKTILEKIDEDPCKDFSMEHFPPVLRQYIEGICETTEAHPIMIVMSVLCSISAMVGKKVYMPKGEYFQDLYPNIWSLCINKSGGFKTTALNNGSRLAFEKDKKILELMEDLKNKEDPNFNLLEDNKKFSDQLRSQLRAESLKRPILPTRTSTEFLIKHLSEGHQGMIVSSEIGEWLGNMQKQHNIDLKQIFTYFYDVDIFPYEHRTKNCGNYIVREPFITINGVSTIDWVEKHVKVDDIFSGFFARMLLFAPPFENKTPPARQKKRKNSEKEFHSKKKIAELLEHLGNISFSFSESTGIQFDNIHNSLDQMVKTGRYDERCQKFLEPYLKRWSPYILKLAMLFRIIEDPLSNELSSTSIKAGTEIVRIAIKSTAKLFEKELGESEDHRKQRIVFENILSRAKNGKKTSFEHIVRSRILSGGFKEYEEVLETLDLSGKIALINPDIKNKKKREYAILQNQ